jgi:hypothetical protein
MLEIFKINLLYRALGSAVDVIEVTTGGWMSRLRLKLDDLVTTMTLAFLRFKKVSKKK